MGQEGTKALQPAQQSKTVSKKKKKKNQTGNEQEEVSEVQCCVRQQRMEVGSQAEHTGTGLQWELRRGVPGRI